MAWHLAQKRQERWEALNTETLSTRGGWGVRRNNPSVMWDDKWQSEYWVRTGLVGLSRPPIKSQWDPVTTARYFMWTNRGSGVHPSPPMVTPHTARPASPQLILLSEDGLNAEHWSKHQMSRLNILSGCAVTGRAMSYFHWSGTSPGILVSSLLIKTWGVFDNCRQDGHR